MTHYGSAVAGVPAFADSVLVLVSEQGSGWFPGKCRFPSTSPSTPLRASAKTGRLSGLKPRRNGKREAVWRSSASLRAGSEVVPSPKRTSGKRSRLHRQGARTGRSRLHQQPSAGEGARATRDVGQEEA